MTIETKTKIGTMRYRTTLELWAEVMRSTEKLVPAIRRRDHELGDQCARARVRACMALGEADGRRGGNRRQRLREADGEMAELACGLRMAAMLGYLDAEAVETAVRVGRTRTRDDDVAPSALRLTRSSAAPAGAP